MHCKNCEFLTFSQDTLATHNCYIEDEKIQCPGYFLCKNTFTSKDSLKIHLQIDHKVSETELDKFLSNIQLFERQQQKYQIDDYQLLKKSDNSELATNKSKSKIFIKDVTLLRKPDLPPNDINLPNIFDSLDLTTTEDDIFDDFLGSDEPEDFDFDFEEPAANHEPDDEIIATSEIVSALPGKIYVRKNLCTTEDAVEKSELKTAYEQSSTSKIYVRSHESLTSQVIETDVNQQPSPSESSTPDCVIVPTEVVKEPTSTSPPIASQVANKIFIRNIETLTNPQTQTQDPLSSSSQFFDENVTNTAANYLTHPNTNYVNAFTPSIYVRSYDSLVSDTLKESPPIDNTEPRCKISIKNMNTLIEPTLMNPPLMIFGQAQNLVIHMRPNQTTDEALINYRDSSVTPDTLPGSSNVSVCSRTDNDVIILDDSEINDSSFATYSDVTDLQTNEPMDVCDFLNPIDDKVIAEEQAAAEAALVVETNVEVENPERNQTPNDKPKIDLESHESNQKNVEDQPMTRIPISMPKEEHESEPTEPKRKKLKIIKIIRVKNKKSSLTSTGIKNIDPLDAVQVVFKCNISDCSLTFSNDKLLNYHKKCHLNDNQISCPECKSEDFKTYNTLHTHLWRQHNIDMDLYSCELCNFKTPILSRLKNFHEKIHSDEKNYKCEFLNCNKRFKNSKQLKNHSQIHKAAKQRDNKNNKSAQSNANTDNDLKKIKCQMCQKAFSSESGLYIHFMEHKNEEKRFICEEKGCEYSTNDHNSFRRHKFQHSKTHQYSCPACDYTSIQSNTYRKHLEKNHKELAESLLFKCGSCKFITISKSKFEGHAAKHSADA